MIKPESQRRQESSRQAREKNDVDFARYTQIKLRSGVSYLPGRSPDENAGFHAELSIAVTTG